MPPKKSGPKIKRPTSPTPSEQEILAALPDAGDLVTRTEQKTPAHVIPAYLIYVVLRTDPDKLTNVVVRKSYESKTEAAEAFAREYGVWITRLYPRSHTKEELSRAYLINLIDAEKAKTSDVSRSSEIDPSVQHTVFIGRGKVEYEIIHRDDKEMDKQDHRQRKVVIMCEETRHEAL